MTTKDTNKTLNRRELLKALAATGGAVTAATMLPGKWTKPVIEAGVLPAHAQTSALIISNFRLSRQTQTQGQGGGPLCTFEYSDGLGGVTGDTILYVTLEYPDEADVKAEAIYNWDEPFNNLDWNGDGFSGTVDFPIFGFGDFYHCGPIDATIYIKNTDGRTSNELGLTISDIPC